MKLNIIADILCRKSEYAVIVAAISVINTADCQLTTKKYVITAARSTAVTPKRQ